MYLSTCRLTAATVLCWLILIAPVAAGQGGPPAPPVSCRACLLMDDTGRVLAERSSDLRLPNASTTKMVTAILVERRVQPDALVRVSAFAASTGEAGLDLQSGDTYRVAELLYGLLLTSSNDAAVALAEHVSGTEQAFVDEMNAYAASIGATDTHFVTAHGLDRPDHYASAHDLALIAQELLADPVLARIVRTPETTVQGERLENRNLLLDTYRGAIGVKTGQTEAAGNVLVAAAERQGRRLIVVVMDSVDSFADSAALLDHGFAVLARTVVVAKGAPAGDIVFDTSGAIPLVIAKPVRSLHRASDLHPVIRLEQRMEPPIRRGERVGSVRYMANGKEVAVVPVVAGGDLSLPRSSWAADLLAGMLSALSFLALGARV